MSKYWFIILFLVGALLAVSLHYSSKLEIGFDNLSALPKHSPIKSTVKRLDSTFGGLQKFEILIDTHQPNGILDPKFLAQLKTFEQRAEALPRGRLAHPHEQRQPANPRDRGRSRHLYPST